jgi:chaperonin GroES
MTLMILYAFLLLLPHGCLVQAWALPMRKAHAPTTTSSSRLYMNSSDASSPTTATKPKEYTLDGQIIRGPLQLLNNNILVKVKESLTATAGGILLPDQSKQRPTEGTVVAVGPGRFHPQTGERIPNPIPLQSQKGTTVSVLYGQFDGRPLNYQGEDCQMIRDDQVLLYYTGVTMKLDTVVPVRDYVLVKLADPSAQQGTGAVTKSGVVLAGQVFQDQVPCQGTVVKVGEGRLASDGQLYTPSPVQVGHVVKFKEYAGNDVTIDGEDYSVVKMVDILCTTAVKE